MTMSGAIDAVASMREQEIIQLKGAIEMQSTAHDITRRKIEAMNDGKKAVWRVFSERIEEARVSNKKSLADAIIEQRRAESALRTCEIEQTELHHAVESQMLNQMKERLQMLQDPSPLVQARLSV